MASWNEIERLRKEPKRFRALAERLLAHETSEWELGFLESVIAKPDEESSYSNRQGEKLLEIRDNLEPVDSIRGFSIKILLKGVHDARVDLSEEDDACIVALSARATDMVRRGEAYRLLRLARQLGIVEGDEAAA